VNDPAILPERWLPVAGYEGYYEVSDRGRVRSLDRLVIDSRGWRKRWHGRILRPGLNPNSYFVVALCRDGRSKSYLVNRLVLEAFDKPCPEGQESRHGPGGKQDNRWPENLCWGTKAENEADKLRDGTDQHGERGPGAKLTWAEVMDIRQRYAAGGVFQRELASEYRVTRQTIGDVVNRTWREVA